MVTPELLDATLTVLRKHNIMSFNIESGTDKFSGTLAPDFEPPAASNEPGGWKTPAEAPSDPNDPDPLGLGPLDAPMPLDDDEVNL